MENYQKLKIAIKFALRAFKDVPELWDVLEDIENEWTRSTSANKIDYCLINQECST